MVISFLQIRAVAAAVLVVGLVAFARLPLMADGLMKGPAEYKGSLEESSQEAIIIMSVPGRGEAAQEDLILKITVEGEVNHFAWVIPFPNQPEVNQADAKLFKELFDYVDFRLQARKAEKMKKFGGASGGFFGGEPGVEVLSREVVGSYDVAVVRETIAGKLNEWLETEGYQQIENGDDVTEFYRKKGYVFACVKVSDAQLEADKPVDLHPLRFTFLTGGRDGIYFPMKMTGLQKERFAVNLYVFYRAWINDRLNKFGYAHRGFSRKYRDWDGPNCQPNAGKLWSQPLADPFLRDASRKIPTVAELFAELHPGKRFYLTNIRAFQLEPAQVRNWPDDLWLFPYYVNQRFVPYDARPGGPAAGWATNGGDGT